MTPVADEQWNADEQWDIDAHWDIDGQWDIDEQWDVVVLGGGLAGACAADAAGEQGARVLLLEKRGVLGGSSVLSAGLIAYADTEEQRAAGIHDSAELLRRDLIEVGKHRADEALIERYCTEQADTYRWLREHGAVFGAPRAASGQSVPRSHPVDIAALIDRLVSRARGRGARLSYRARATRLLMDGAEHAVGVRIEGRDGTRDVRAGAVVIATGGFVRSPQLLARFAPAMDLALKAGGEANTGDGLLMGCKVGAGLADTPYVKGTFGIFPWPSPAEGGHGILAVYKGAIAVNGEGHRFIDESLPYKEIGDACLAQTEGIAFQILDDSVLAQTDPEVPIYDFAPRLAAGQLQQADTLGGLAELLGIPTDALQHSVEDYNERIARGEPDAFGRATLSGGVGRPRPIQGPPYYGYPCTSVLLATYCGLTVDTTAHVVDVFGERIHGLFAAGEVTGGFHGAGYVTGTSLGKSAVFGRIAGREAARAAAWRAANVKESRHA
ncbi:MAG: FAD-dependent oxidoreductase [Jatrophihabitantaceae bacterium]